MGILSGTKKVIGHMINFRIDHWLDLNNLKQTTQYYWDQYKNLFRIQKTLKAESFDEAVERMTLSSETLLKQAKRYLKLTFFFIWLALALVVYGIVLIHLQNLMGAIISFALSLYALSLAFRFHFWYFQITQQKLGCTFNEWYQTLLSARTRRKSS